MLGLAVLAVCLSLVAAGGSAPSNGGLNLPGVKDPNEFNEFDKANIQLYQRCNDLEAFKPGMLGYWMGRTQMTDKTYLREYDIHGIKKDGSGILNGRSETDHSKIARVTPTKMWCKSYRNGQDKTVKVQFGPTQYGQLICMDLEIDDKVPDVMNVGVNQVLFTDARVPLAAPVALDCLNYPYQSKYNSYTVWADQLYRPSYVKWDRTTKPEKGGDWDLSETKTLVALLKALSQKS